MVDGERSRSPAFVAVARLPPPPPSRAARVRVRGGAGAADLGDAAAGDPGDDVQVHDGPHPRARQAR